MSPGGRRSSWHFDFLSCGNRRCELQWKNIHLLVFLTSLPAIQFLAELIAFSEDIGMSMYGVVEQPLGVKAFPPEGRRPQLIKTMSSLQRFQVSVLPYKSRKTPRLEKQQQLLRGGDCLNPPVHLPTSYAGRPWNAR